MPSARSPRSTQRTKLRAASLFMAKRLMGSRTSAAKQLAPPTNDGAEPAASPALSPRSTTRLASLGRAAKAASARPAAPPPAGRQRVVVRVARAAGLPHDASTYAKVLVNNEWVGKTRKVPRCGAPRWGDHAKMELVVPADGRIDVTVCLAEYADDETGRCVIDARKLLRGQGPGEHRGWHAVAKARRGGAPTTLRGAYRLARAAHARARAALHRVHVEIVVTDVVAPPALAGRRARSVTSGRGDVVHGSVALFDRRRSPLRILRKHAGRRPPSWPKARRVDSGDGGDGGDADDAFFHRSSCGLFV